MKAILHEITFKNRRVSIELSFIHIILFRVPSGARPHIFLVIFKFSQIAFLYRDDRNFKYNLEIRLALFHRLKHRAIRHVCNLGMAIYQRIQKLNFHSSLGLKPSRKKRLANNGLMVNFGK